MKNAAFIDGFNLYHAIHDLKQDYLKWVDIRKLCKVFAPTPQHELEEIFYFSAYATWQPDAFKRHREFVKALEATGVTSIMGKFKEKQRQCFACGYQWSYHEEKQTDVNIALHLLHQTSLNGYDRILLITGDSDLAPAIRMVRSQFPALNVRVISPVGRKFSMDLVHAAGGKKHAIKMKQLHLERSLFDQEVKDSEGRVMAVRPVKYDPPDPVQP